MEKKSNFQEVLSFSQRVKNELIAHEIEAQCCALSELSAILRTAGSLAISGGQWSLSISSETELLKDRVDMLLLVLYGETASEAEEEINIGKRLFSFSLSPHITPQVMGDCGIVRQEGDGLEFVKGIDTYLFLDECCKKAYLKGAFLGSGTVQVPDDALKGSFYLGISHIYREYAEELCTLADELGLTGGKVAERNAKYALYFKSKESVRDFLALCGATKSYFYVTDVIIRRELRGDANRSVNCINANISKTVNAGMAQVKQINYLRACGAFSEMPDGLRQAALLREQNPNLTLSQMAEQLGISKSGLRHRFEKIEKFYIACGGK